MTESALYPRMMEAATAMGHRLFRNNRGLFFTRPDATGESRPVMCGLANGSGDLIGFTVVEITQEMVGQRIAVFTSVEAKTRTGSPGVVQRNWLEMVRTMGGIAVIARSVEEMVAYLRTWRKGCRAA